MKKILFVLIVNLLIYFVYFNFNNKRINALSSEEYYINKKDIFISKNEYEKLIMVGYTPKEIEIMNYSEYEKIANMNISTVLTETYYIKTMYNHNIDENNRNDVYFATEDELIEDIKKSKDELKQFNTNNARSLSPNPSLNDDQEIVGSPYIPATSTLSNEYKVITVNGTYYSDFEAEGKFFVKVNVEWLEAPQKRYNDVITINFTDNVQIKSEYINGNQYAAFDSKMTYDETFTDAFYGILPTYTSDTITKTIEINGENIGEYSYYVDKGIAVTYDLPNDSSVTYNYSDGFSFRTQETICSNFFITLSADFIPKNADINAATFIGTYQHQTANGHFDWGEVTLSVSPPYFSYSTGIWNNTPLFDEKIETLIFFENLSAY